MKTIGLKLLKYLPLTGAYFFIELASFILLRSTGYALGFGAAWAILLTGICMLLPRLAGRIFFGITYFFVAGWMLAQAAYYQIFHKLMWLSDMRLAGEGGAFLGDVLSAFPILWWVFLAVLIVLGVLIIALFPKTGDKTMKVSGGVTWAVGILILSLMPMLVYQRDVGVWGTRSEFAQATSYRAIYKTMYDANNTYRISGIYQLTARDFWKHEIYPLTPFSKISKAQDVEKLNQYFAKRPVHEANDMTGIYKGKNIILVMMESMDDWMLTEEETPTLLQMMEEGIQFTDFYSPLYGSARTFNTEFCMNTGEYLPTTGTFVFDYVTNEYHQSLPSLMKGEGYRTEVFHYNTAKYYSRGVFEAAMGYDKYHAYSDYETEKAKLYDDLLLFDDPGLSEAFFAEGPKLNTVITRSAHMTYLYSEALSKFALKKYPEYRGKYGSEEENCARVKAKLVDDLFARMLVELEAHGELENTVIIGITDHYTYGYKNKKELMQLSGVEEELLLEKTPMFIWSADKPSMVVDKTLNTADFLPTILNMLGIDSPYFYLGQDAFDENYEGYAIFADGSFISDGLVCEREDDGTYRVIANETGAQLTEEIFKSMASYVEEYREMANLLLTSDYYSQVYSE